MKNFDILIFIQAAADLRYAVDIIDKNKNKKIQVFVIHVEGIYKFITSLNLKNVQIEYQDYFEFNLRDFTTYFKVKNQLNSFWINKFQDKTYKDVYFFSRFYDFHTASMIVRFGNKSNIIYYDHYDTTSILNDSLVRKNSLVFLKRQYIALITTFVSKAKFISKFRKRFLEFDYKFYSIDKIEVREQIVVNKNYKYQIPNIKHTKNIIFVLSPEELKMISNEALVMFKEILQILKNKGFSLYLKGHPRLGEPIEVKHLFNQVIPSYVPAEFLNYNDFNFTIGIMSSGLVYPAQFKDNKVLSIMDLLEFNNSEDKLFYYNFLREHSKGKVEFIKNLGFFASISII